MKLNLAKIQQQVAAKKPQAKSLQPVASSPTPAPAPDYTKLEMIESLSTQMARIKKERAILSSGIAPLVEQVYQALKEESPAIASEFMEGKYPAPEIAAHYKLIQQKTEEWTSLWDKVRYVEQYGKMPVDNVQLTIENGPAPEVSVLTAEIRRLDDLIHKTYKKLQTGNPKNSDRRNEWKTKIALAEATRDELKRKRKNLQYGARAQRIGGE